MIFPRSSGILLHPTSLPGRYGIGDLGEWSYRFVDYLEAAGQTIWQVLPLGPTSYGDSPYQCLSAFAGNPNLISLDKLVDIGWLSSSDLDDVPSFPVHSVDFGPVIEYHNAKLHLAWENFKARGTAEQKAVFAQWRAEQALWLDDFSVFVALKNSNGGKPWVEWENSAEALHQEAAVIAAKSRLADEIDEQCFRQWLFFEQWTALKKYANSKNIRLVGDIPIFVAHDSSDVWANPHLFYLDELGNPLVVAGVPPDYFSETGQRWGNPLYRWDVMEQEKFRWWIARFRASLSTVDIIRIDHFRGFEAYWEVPASEPTAVRGRWVPGPQDAFFDAVQDALGALPIIAEDLGVITPGVERLRDKYGLPGMKVLQFAFGTSDDGRDPFLPHNHVPNCVVYTGTHDNNTTVGWWQSGEADKESRKRLRQYIGHEVERANWELIRMGMSSVAHTFVMPLQDVLGFGADTRMNTPGNPSGNWTWRFTPEWFEHKSHERLARYTRFFYRWHSDEEADK
ncbi:MAG: 4-alpha-glucanotransferase [Anaerolineae bacterium]|nr:4-alpha-glucanotransferase [Anaerolineae bacterium]